MGLVGRLRQQSAHSTRGPCGTCEDCGPRQRQSVGSINRSSSTANTLILHKTLMTEPYTLPPCFGTTGKEEQLLDGSLWDNRFSGLDQSGKIAAE